jgi:hypothetical protein
MSLVHASVTHLDDRHTYNNKCVVFETKKVSRLESLILERAVFSGIKNLKVWTNWQITHIAKLNHAHFVLNCVCRSETHCWTLLLLDTHTEAPNPRERKLLLVDARTLIRSSLSSIGLKRAGLAENKTTQDNSSNTTTTMRNNYYFWQLFHCQLSLLPYPGSSTTSVGQKWLLVGGTHGNEYTGVWCIKALGQADKLLRRQYPSLTISTLLESTSPLRNKRFVEEDLNHRSHTSTHGVEDEYSLPETAECTRAKETLRSLVCGNALSTDVVVDLHSTTSNMWV